VDVDLRPTLVDRRSACAVVANRTGERRIEAIAALRRLRNARRQGSSRSAQ
jgi:hypothetical protein